MSLRKDISARCNDCQSVVACRISSGEIPDERGCARADDGGSVLVLGVDGIVEAADAGRGEFSIETPGRALGPVAQGFSGPGGGFIRVTGRAGIWDFVLVCHGRGDESESVSADFDVSKGGLDLRHMAGDALAAGRAGLVMGVLLEGSRAGAVGRHGAVAVETEFVSRLS